MQGWLVYSPEGYARNRWFADRILDMAAGSGAPLELRIVPADGLPPLDRPPDFVVMRAIRPELSAALEARGVVGFPSAVGVIVASGVPVQLFPAAPVAMPAGRPLTLTSSAGSPPGGFNYRKRKSHIRCFLSPMEIDKALRK